MPETRNRERSIAVTMAAVGVIAALGYELVSIVRNISHPDMSSVVAMYGFFAAQTMLIAIWAVFAPVNVVLRLSCWIFFSLATWYIIVFAMLEPNGGLNHSHFGGSAVYGLFVLAGVTFLQIPLWISRHLLRFRMIRPGELPTMVASERLQFQLKDLLLATFILAIALSPIRFVLIYGGFDRIQLFPARSIVIMAVILVVTLPSLWASFAARPSFAAAGRLAKYVLFVTGIEVAIVCALVAPRLPPSVGEVFGAFFIGNAVQSGVVFAVMRIYYALGFRLQRVPKTIQQS